MKKILDLISEELKDAFEAAGYDREFGRVTVSNRPDLCEYQCNGAMAGAKQYKKAPIMIANAQHPNITRCFFVKMKNLIISTPNTIWLRL